MNHLRISIHTWFSVRRFHRSGQRKCPLNYKWSMHLELILKERFKRDTGVIEGRGKGKYIYSTTPLSCGLLGLHAAWVLVEIFGDKGLLLYSSRKLNKKIFKFIINKYFRLWQLQEKIWPNYLDFTRHWLYVNCQGTILLVHGITFL